MKAVKELFSFKDSRVKLAAVIRSDVALVFFIILAFSLMVLVSYFFIKTIVEKQIFNNAQATLNTAEANIRADLREAEVTFLQMEILVRNRLKEGYSAEDMKSYVTMLADTVLSGDMVHGFMNIYGMVGDQLHAGLYEHVDASNYFPEERPWFHAAESGKGRTELSAPYIDSVTGTLVVSLAKIMYDEDGSRIGTLALDIDFTNISSYVITLHFGAGGYGIVCDNDFSFIIHPFSNFLGNKMDESGSAYAEVAKKLRENPGITVTQNLKNEMNASVVMICRQISNGWYLGIVTPVSSYYHDVNVLIITLSILGFIFMVALSLILIRLSLLKARSDEQNQGKTSFLARMSHEIRTPMNSILGMAELIRRKAISSDIQEYIEIIHQSGNNLLSIINDLLDFSKIESGRLQIQNRDYNIASVVNDMINMMRPRIAEKSLDFLVNVDSSIPASLYGDDMRLRQILTNLLSNAVKYTRKGFISFEMQAKRIDGNVIKLICSVSDSGIGIKPEDHGRLFNDFVRIDNQVNQGIEGTGLGLVITNALCRAMGGDITVSSEYGKGSTFRAVVIQEIKNDVPVAKVNNPERKRVLFYDWRLQYMQSISNALYGLGASFKCSQDYREFIHDLEYGQFDYAFVTSKYAMDCIFALGRRATPLQLVIMAEPGEMSIYQEVMSIMMPVYSIPLANVLNNEPEGKIIQDKNIRVKFTAPSARVLIVDDISTNLRVAKELMSPYNMTVHTCLSGSEALTLVKNNIYDMVFMDHMMPGMDGVEATGFIRSLETGDGYYKNLPIIMFTANAVTGQREMFLENDINDFLAKPIDIQKLNDVLEQWLPAEKILEASLAGREDVKAEKAELPVINGLDVDVGLKNCNGGLAIYLSILNDFCNDTEIQMTSISKAYMDADARLYSTLVHALKGAARSVGAVIMGDEASWLENMSASGDFDIISEKNAMFFENTRTLIYNIKTALAMYEADRNVKSIGIADLNLLELKKALSDMDIKAVNTILLGYTSLPLQGKLKETISDVEQLILMFEYEAAINKIDELNE